MVGVVCLVKICDCLRVLCPVNWSFVRPLRDVDVSLSRIPLAGVPAEISVDSGSFLALSSLGALETESNDFKNSRFYNSFFNKEKHQNL